MFAALIALGWFLVVYRRRRTGLRSSTKQHVFGVLAALGTIALVVLVASVAELVVVDLFGISRDRADVDMMLTVGECLLAVAAALWAAGAFGRRWTAEPLGPLLFFTFALVGTSVFAPALSYVVLLPVGCALAAVLTRDAAGRVRLIGELTTALLVAVAVAVVTTNALLFTSVFLHPAPAAALVGFTLWLIAASLASQPNARSEQSPTNRKIGRWPTRLTLATAAGMIALAIAVDLNDGEQRPSGRVFYALDRDTGEAVWLTPDGGSNPSLSANASLNPAELYFPFLRGQSVPTAPAPLTSLCDATVRLRSAASDSSRVALDIATSGAGIVGLYLESAVGDGPVMVNDQLVAKRDDGTVWLQYWAPPSEGIGVEIPRPPGGAVALRVVLDCLELPQAVLSGGARRALSISSHRFELDPVGRSQLSTSRSERN